MSQLLNKAVVNPSTPTLEALSPRKYPELYNAVEFDILWDKLRYRGILMAKQGVIGYRVAFSKNSKPSKIWEYGADLEWIID